MSKIRVHTDTATVDIETKNPAKYVEHVATKGVWINANKFLPPSRIVFIELITDGDENKAS